MNALFDSSVILSPSSFLLCVLCASVVKTRLSKLFIHS